MSFFSGTGFTKGGSIGSKIKGANIFAGAGFLKNGSLNGKNASVNGSDSDLFGNKFSSGSKKLKKISISEPRRIRVREAKASSTSQTIFGSPQRSPGAGRARSLGADNSRWVSTSPARPLLLIPESTVGPQEQVGSNVGRTESRVRIIGRIV